MRDEGKVTGDELANRRLGKRNEAIETEYS